MSDTSTEAPITIEDGVDDDLDFGDEEADLAILRQARAKAAEAASIVSQATAISAPAPPTTAVYHGVKLREQQLRVLSDPRGWIDDELLNFWFQILKHETFGKSRRVLLMRPAISFMLMLCSSESDFKQNAAPLKLTEKDLILIPITDERHWALLVYTRDDNTVRHATACIAHCVLVAVPLLRQRARLAVRHRSAPHHATRTLLPRKQRFRCAPALRNVLAHATSAVLQVSPAPQQVNDWDCGSRCHDRVQIKVILRLQDCM